MEGERTVLAPESVRPKGTASFNGLLIISVIAVMAPVLGPSAAAVPAEPLMVWCGNGHACKEAMQEWVPMGWHFRAKL
jgi:hypothetical protein